MDDIHYSVCAGNTKRVPLEKPAMLDEIWMANHHSFAKEYIKAYYNHENVKIMPYIWDPFFLQDRIQQMQKKNLSPFFVKRINLAFVYSSQIYLILKILSYQ